VSQPGVFVESQERRNLTLVKRRRRRRDFLPFMADFIRFLYAGLYAVPTPNPRKTYASAKFHNIRSEK
jgi:hypothetical protein